MKKLVLFSLFVITSGFLSAQCSHAHGTSAKVEKNCQSASVVSEAALKAMSEDPSIEKRVCEGSGMVCFKKKTVDAATGDVSYADVKYDEGTAQFVSYTPESTKSEGKSCCKSGKKGKSCCKKGSKSCSKSETSENIKSSGSVNQ